MERLTRQQIYDRIRETSKEEYILSEMKRLGFWKATEGLPKLSETLITQKGELRRELSQLVEKQRKYQDRERLLKEMRQKRMKEALERRAETKKKREEERLARAARWKAIKATNIIYLGKSVSAGLNAQENTTSLLEKNNLPYFENIEKLAKAMDISLAELRFLSFNRTTSKVTHYRRFTLPKKSGGERVISAPMPRLKKLQYWLLENILYKLPLHEAAEGFVPGKSILSNAQKHVGKKVVINMDMKDFFPTITYKRVKGLFKSFGYSEQIATIFALLSTAAETDEILIDGERYFVAKGERKLPQGAPSSPAITNIICQRLDKRFQGMANKLDWTYSRYADDISLSSKKGNDLNRVLWQSNQIINDEGFKLHPNKLKIMWAGRQQEVTGLVVNQRPTIARKKLKQFRSVLHKIEKNGIDGLSWGSGFILLTIQGFANYVKMIHPEKGDVFVKQVNAILAKPENKVALTKYWQEKTTLKRQQQQVNDEVAPEIFNSTGLDTDLKTEFEQKQEWWKLW